MTLNCSFEWTGDRSSTAFIYFLFLFLYCIYYNTNHCHRIVTVKGSLLVLTRRDTETPFTECNSTAMIAFVTYEREIFIFTLVCSSCPLWFTCLDSTKFITFQHMPCWHYVSDWGCFLDIFLFFVIRWLRVLRWRKIFLEIQVAVLSSGIVLKQGLNLFWVGL